MWVQRQCREVIERYDSCEQVFISAARVWWMFHAFSHTKVSILNGGLPKLEHEGRAVTHEVSTPPASFNAIYRPTLVRSIDDMLANVTSGREQVADARTAGRFTGDEPEPRAGMRSGHIPGSVSLPFTQLLATDRTFLNAPQLQEVLEQCGLDLDKPITASCGSGVTACVIAFSCYLLGKDDVAIYDGSWSEWGGRPDTPVATGTS